MRIPISEIKITPGRQEADTTQINELSKSIADVGLLDPITVDSNHTLIAGLHRLEAARLLSWTEIECTICSIDSIRAKLAEIDENVIRRNLTNIEQSKLLARRKKLYETLHPETIARNRPGHVNNYQSSSDNMSLEPKVKSFVEDTAEKLGVSTRTIERHLWLAEHLAPKATQILKKMGKQQPSQSELIKLARLEPDQQAEAAALFVSNAIKSVDEYLKRMEPKTYEVAAPCMETSFDNFIECSNQMLNEMKCLCTSLTRDIPAFTPEQVTKAQAQIVRLHQAVDDLAAQLENMW